MKRKFFGLVMAINFKNYNTIQNFKPISQKVKNYLLVTKIDKIKINQNILVIQNLADFKTYWNSNKIKFNLINHTTYLRRFTDLIIQNGNLESEQQSIKETFDEISIFLNQMSQKPSTDQRRDIARSFTMLLSICAEMYTTTDNMKNNAILDFNFLQSFALQVNNLIKINASYEDMNQYELANYYRAMIWLKQQNIVRENSEWITYKEIQKIKLSNLVKLFHSFCEAELQDSKILQILITQIIQQQKIQQIQYQDVESIFSCTIPLKHENYLNLIEVTARTILYQNTQLAPKTIAIVLNRLANLIPKIAQISYEDTTLNNLLLYCENQIRGKCQELKVQGLAHIVNFYARVSQIQNYKRELPFTQKELLDYSNSIDINLDELVLLLTPLLEENYIVSPDLLDSFLKISMKLEQSIQVQPKSPNDLQNIMRILKQIQSQKLQKMGHQTQDSQPTQQLQQNVIQDKGQNKIY